MTIDPKRYESTVPTVLTKEDLARLTYRPATVAEVPILEVLVNSAYVHERRFKSVDRTTAEDLAKIAKVCSVSVCCVSVCR